VQGPTCKLWSNVTQYKVDPSDGNKTRQIPNLDKQDTTSIKKTKTENKSSIEVFLKELRIRQQRSAGPENTNNVLFVGNDRRNKKGPMKLKPKRTSFTKF
jgi:hypothetical protein